jgi:hypothetical protein
MGEQAIENLDKAEARLVELRRQLASEMISHPRVGEATIDRFVKVQEAVEALQRARKDEAGRPAG